MKSVLTRLLSLANTYLFSGMDFDPYNFFEQLSLHDGKIFETFLLQRFFVSNNKDKVL